MRGTVVVVSRSMIEGIFADGNYQTAKALLDASALRHKALASNLANLETPGYRRVELSRFFEEQLISHVERGEFERISQLKPTLSEDPNSSAVRPDGNNVELDNELVEIGRNSLEHEVLTRFLSGSLNLLKKAITGQST